jgi:hypothetical protein
MKAAPGNRVDFSVRLVVVLSFTVALAMLLCILWAASVSSVFEGLRYLAGYRWGIVTLVDVYAGALVVAIWMWTCERGFVTWAVWVLVLLCLGHFVSLVYLLIRAARSKTLLEVFAPRLMPARGAPRQDFTVDYSTEDQRSR